MGSPGHEIRPAGQLLQFDFRRFLKDLIEDRIGALVRQFERISVFD